MAEVNLDETTLSTLSLLESRLLRIEQLLHGQTTTPTPIQNDTAALKLKTLEKRFSALHSGVRVYGELLKIYKTHPDFFHSPNPSDPPTQLSSDELQAIVLAAASSYPATVSSLTAIKDSPIPDPADSAALIALTGKMRAIEATQLAQAAEIAELRARSEKVVRTWYESSVLRRSEQLADVEGRVERVERHIRRAEREREEAKKI